ncbi:MAG: GNAT family N-acetyltransferase, partial [Candidatus Methanomethylicaceae archaeon]
CTILVISIREANQNDLRALSKKLLTFLEDKSGKVYQENVAKFDIPEDYVRKAFEEDRLIEALKSNKTAFYLALMGEEIIGFAQTVTKDTDTAELDRIVIFPEHERRGFGTRLLKYVLLDLKTKGVSTIIVNAGKEEVHARMFYEKNGFRLVDEITIDAPWERRLDLVKYQLSLK